MSSRIPCPQCGSDDTERYDGALGYEAVRCNACFEETDLNNEHAHSPRPDRRPAAAPIQDSPEYQKAFALHAEAAHAYAGAVQRYKKGELGPTLFGAMRDLYDGAVQEFDKAFRANIEYKRIQAAAVRARSQNTKTFLVISLDISQRSTYRDYVIEKSKDGARKFIADQRPECFQVDCLDLADLADHTRNLNDIAEAADLLAAMEQSGGGLRL